MDVGEHESMKKAVNTILGGELEEKEAPSNYFVELKSDEVESSNPTADDLKNVASMCHEGGAESFLGANILTDGRLQVRRSTVPKGYTPQNAEEFRLGHKLLGYAWMLVNTKHSNQTWRQDSNEKRFTRLTVLIISIKVSDVESKR